MRLIDADELRSLYEDDEYSAFRTSMRVIQQNIDDMPTIDAVPVVRCCDCFYFAEAKVNSNGFLICPASGMEITDDDYCSYGRREDI